MLREGRLTGPSVPPGRAPAGVGRVWRGSLAAEQERRDAATRQPPLRTRREADSAPKEAVRRPYRPARDSAEPGTAPSAWAAVQELKVALDVARDALRSERAHSARLTQVLADLLKSQQEQGRRLDAIAQGYSDALTQLLGPDSAEDL